MAVRTTVTLDPDAEALIKREMKERDVSFKKAVNDAIVRGLTVDRKAQAEEYNFPTYNMGKPKIDITKALLLAAELEDAEIIRKLQQGK